jgi:hypothetical protein
MSSIKAYLLSPDGQNYADHKADFGFLKETFDRNKIETINVDKIPKSDRAFVVIPGYDAHGKEHLINKQLSKLGKVVLFITSDESGFFDVDKIDHPNIDIWVQSPFEKHRGYNTFPIGAPSFLKDNLPEYTDKEYEVFFAGQITHCRRQELDSVMDRIPNSLYNPTSGFMQGYSLKEYYEHMSKSRVVPAPAGNVTIDSFRFYEAIEMLSLPLADGVNSKDETVPFWDLMFDDMPARIVYDWKTLPKIMPELIKKYPANVHKVVSWWLLYKRNFANKIMEQLNEH